MRKSCVDCCKKHLGSASVLEDEIRNGYPAYELYFLGHLDQAASEIMKASRKMAEVIREHRVKWMYDHNHDIPFEEMWSNLETLSQMTEEEREDFVPYDVYAGLDMKDDALLTTGDTRP